MSDASEGPWVLNCNYCMWTSLDVGIKFDKPTNIRSQLDKIANGGRPKQPSTQKADYFSDPSRKSSVAREPFSPYSAPLITSPPPSTDAPLDPSARFAALKAFYKTQLALATTDPATPATDSPSSLARIVNLYTGVKKPLAKQGRVPTMREALTPAEGLRLPPTTPTLISTTTDPPKWSNTITTPQRLFQHPSGSPTARTVSSLRPTPTLLRTKRAKRCAACKHILVKPETKPTSTRFRIKLTALSYIPSVSLKPLHSGVESGSASVAALEPGRPSQYVLTLKNCLFDTVKVSLGTPAVTPGRYGHRVTVLCPLFEVGASGDVWDDALGNGNGDKAKRASVQQGVGVGLGAKGESVVAEAGKVFERGRNWTSVVVEVVPVHVNVNINFQATGLGGEEAASPKEQANEEDADVIEIPIRVRLEWRQSDADEGGGAGRTKSAKVNEIGEDESRRELAYWMVLGVGRVAS